MKSKMIVFTLLVLHFLGAGCSSSNKADSPQDAFITGDTSTIITKDINYVVDGQTMKGFLAIPEGEGPFPGVLVVHEWWGQTDYPRNRAKQLARNGYMAFAVDMYGEGQTASHPNDAKKFSSKVMSDMNKAEKSFVAALRTLKKQPNLDSKNIAAMGYCFGGAVVLEMARRGVPVKLVASYHGNLTPLAKNDVSKMKSRVLIFNGGADTFMPKGTVANVRSKLKAAGVRYKLVNYKGAKHGFTNPEADKNAKEFGIDLGYDKRADESSWEETMKAFKTVFK